MRIKKGWWTLSEIEEYGAKFWQYTLAVIISHEREEFLVTDVIKVQFTGLDKEYAAFAARFDSPTTDADYLNDGRDTLAAEYLRRRIKKAFRLRGVSYDAHDMGVVLAFGDLGLENAQDWFNEKDGALDLARAEMDRYYKRRGL